MIKECIIEWLTDALLVSLAGNLLYLFFKRVWIEPNLLILIAEFLFLSVAIILGVWRYIRWQKQHLSNKGG